jgi:hypothetical protein
VDVGEKLTKYLLMFLIKVDNFTFYSKYALSCREKIYMYAWSYREKKLHQTSAFIPIHFLVAFIIFK